MKHKKIHMEAGEIILTKYGIELNEIQAQEGQIS